MKNVAEPGHRAGALKVRPRYYRWGVDPGVEWTEANTRHAHLEWRIPVSQCALVLVDVWDNHYLGETKSRAEVIIRGKLKPLVEVCRERRVAVIHAPSPLQAQEYPQWVGRNDAQGETQWQSARREPGAKNEWPPRDFRARRGPYAAYARSQEPRDPELTALRANLKVHPDVEPHSDDVVIATGDELHTVCREREILFLFYVGFNTNACILERDYGLREMTKRGYTGIVVRDCTTAMESYRSLPTLGQTHAAIEKIEMFLGYSVTSDEMIRGLGAGA